MVSFRLICHLRNRLAAHPDTADQSHGTHPVTPPVEQHNSQLSRHEIDVWPENCLESLLVETPHSAAAQWLRSFAVEAKRTGLNVGCGRTDCRDVLDSEIERFEIVLRRVRRLRQIL